ncbi:MAG: YdeI/OmpD-associated family protein [Lautropia sp.]
MTADSAKRRDPGIPLEVPPELMVELRKDVLANRLFERMSDAHRREYIKWVADPANRSTRVSRAQKAIALVLDKGES